ncbi:ABC transporter ATP-binding protein [Alkalihalobacillus pseudalcaliphilus]|uniref:ABC transporter ATP-binding protein n=1 Tax=Alkalihalobacillus pseudalcaliphilus TaxID=79884 RepID=UPI00064DD60F|nr:ABC transporter ATP-binding protein [Alkalihalobacillus pseudalcaliphilus]KMK78153.1 ABC transporter ATPase [Alkalihalobacillus pseudalcaliphilus]
MLEAKSITVAFGDNKVLNNLSFTAKKGEIVGLVAPNGTGKTTLFNVMSNYLRPKSGEIVFDEKYKYESEKSEVYIHKHLISFPEQKDLFDDLSGIEHLYLYADMWKGNRKQVKDVVEYLNMGHYVKNKVRTYSLGMRQRLSFAMMVAADTPVMIMDEVMNGLDITNVALISKKLAEMKEENKLIFVASHLLENLDLYADRVWYLKNGHFVHEQIYEEQQDAFIKVDISEEQYQFLKQKYELPLEHHFIAKHKLCFPITGLDMKEQTKWIERFLEISNHELEVGPLGTMEFYERYYLEDE